MDSVDIFKTMIANENLDKLNNNKKVKVANISVSQNFIVKGSEIPHRKILEFSWIFLRVKSIIFWETGDGVHMHMMSDISEELTSMLIPLCYLQKFRKRQVITNGKI